MTINSALYQWASSQIANPVIFRDQDGPQPEGAYVTIKAIAQLREGQAELFHPDANGIIEIKQGLLITCSVQSFGSDLFGDIMTLRDSLNKFTVQSALRESGICFVRVVSEPQDVPAITGTTFEARATMDAIFRADTLTLDDVGLIESARFTGTADGLSVTKTVTQGGIE